MPDSTSVFGGTFAEGLASEGTFGLARPDIVSAEAEKEYPIAATVGRAVGTVAGFIGTTALTGGLLKVALTPFRFGRGILAASGVYGKEVQGVFGSVTRGTAGAVQTGLNFAAQDAAREFIAQMKVEDLDAYEIGRAAAAGALTGGIFGMFHNATVFSHPATQVITGGVSFATAEAINAAAEGDPITEEGVMTTFLMGSALSALGARGWKEKNRAATEASNKQMWKLIEEFDNKDAGLGKSVYNILKTHEPEALKILESHGITKEAIENVPLAKFGAMLGRKTKSGGLSYEGAGEGSVTSGGTGALKSIYDVTKALGLTTNAREVSFAKTTFGGKAKTRRVTVLNDTGKDVVESITGRRVNRPSQLTNAEAKKVHDTISDLVLRDVFHDVDPTKINVVGYGSAGVFGGSAENKMIKYGAADIIRNPTAAARIRNIEIDSIQNAMASSARQFDIAMGGDVKQRVSKFIKGTETTPNMEKLYDILTIQSQSEYEAVLKSLPAEARDAVRSFRKVTDYFYKRTNDALEAMGQPTFKDRAGYMHAMRVFADSAERGQLREIFGSVGEFGKRTRKSITKKTMVTGEGKEITGATFNPTVMAREGEGAIVKDPIRSIMAMASYDLKTIYLDQPIAMLKMQMAVLKKAGQLDSGGEKAIVDYVNTFLLKQPTEKSREWNARLASLIKSGKGEKIYDGLMTRLTGQKWEGRPIDAFDTLWGKAVSNAFIVGRLDLALRNTTQMFHNASVMSNTAFLKAMTLPMDERLKGIVNEIPEFRASVAGVASEGMTTAPGQFSRALGLPFQLSHEKVNVRNLAKGLYFDFLEKVADPKNKLGWATERGIALRKSTGNSKALAPDEIDRLKRMIGTYIPQVQYIYDSPGIPGIFRHAGVKSMFRLQSFQMNYFGNYLNTLWREARTGRPTWARPGENIKLDWDHRAGLLKHFVGLSLLTGIVARAGIDFSDAVGASYNPFAEEGENKFNAGILTFRPSPLPQAFLGAVQAVSGRTEYERMRGKRDFVNSFAAPLTGTIVPGYLGAKTLIRAAEEQDRSVIIFRRPYKAKKKSAVFTNVPTLSSTAKKYGM